MTGQRPSRRMMELLRWHQLDWATDAKLVEGLARIAGEQAAVNARLSAQKAAALKKP
ncbi:MAG: hypothetical protein JWM59_5119 [Verrucomicrobiales bacterium]|nr:hypothetical protein [Verrucomicrobiales bacterium]